MAGNLRIGTCSWKYDSWTGLVYSEEQLGNYLEEYALKYRTVEVDQWFWSLFGEDRVVLPKPAVVQDYANSVPADFRFSIKAPNSLSLTHYYKKQKSDPLIPNPYFLSPRLFEDFWSSLGPLQEKVGAISLQFEYLNKQKMSGQDEFLNALAAFADSMDYPVPICIESRNPNYLNASYFEFLAEHGLGHVYSQGYYLPDIVELYKKSYKYLKGIAMIRLLGPDRSGIEEASGKVWNRIIQPKDGELPDISKMVRHMVNEQELDLYLNVNNHYEGSAPITIDKLEELLAADET